MSFPTVFKEIIMIRSILSLCLVALLAACAAPMQQQPGLQQGPMLQPVSDAGAQTAPSGRSCPAGTSWRRLDWQGHPMHNKEACLPSEAEIAKQKTAFNNARCSNLPGTSWRRLDWPGHPQHGKELCLPSESVIAQQKAGK
jgi:hypothetical protein